MATEKLTKSRHLDPTFLVELMTNSSDLRFCELFGLGRANPINFLWIENKEAIARDFAIYHRWQNAKSDALRNLGVGLYLSYCFC